MKEHINTSPQVKMRNLTKWKTTTLIFNVRPECGKNKFVLVEGRVRQE